MNRPRGDPFFQEQDTKNYQKLRSQCTSGTPRPPRARPPTTVGLPAQRPRGPAGRRPGSRRVREEPMRAGKETRSAARRPVQHAQSNALLQRRIVCRKAERQRHNRRAQRRQRPQLLERPRVTARVARLSKHDVRRQHRRLGSSRRKSRDRQGSWRMLKIGDAALCYATTQ